ncbi:TetR/AcrR family transcriptional regulator [Solihabitans fulvus]|uniref:TetR/AcrR family transcriptional regulator n=1 Tax=Solihabitans fulvus TaxID=1892852 RepID=A0A5B2XGR9_9PSEU|nr:TetR/AcrR family transcriptional regulator [Solihabitans fulvus]KAA2262987.1 TetR/AcrR family transcriptional regulator [Solihabitans fulvus]
MPRKTDTRERVLRSAATLFRDQGYHATGLAQVLTEGDAPKGSMYFHFPGGKEQLAVEAVALTGGETKDALRELLQSTTDLRAGFDLVIERLAENLVSSGFLAGCPIATVALDVAGQNEPIRTACQEQYESWEAVIAEHLRSHGIADADEVATMLLAAIEGGMLLAKTRHDIAPLRVVGAQLHRLLAG